MVFYQKVYRLECYLIYLDTVFCRLALYYRTVIITYRTYYPDGKFAFFLEREYEIAEKFAELFLQHAFYRFLVLVFCHERRIRSEIFVRTVLFIYAVQYDIVLQIVVFIQVLSYFLREETVKIQLYKLQSQHRTGTVIAEHITQ